MIHYDALLQNGTDIITKCDSYFVIKCDKSLLRNASGFLLQNATVLLQNATVITFIMRLLLHIATVHLGKVLVPNSILARPGISQ